MKVYERGDVTVRALDGVDIDIERGSYVAVVGPSGSGKSTLLHLLSALDRPTAGDVMIAGRRVARCDDDELSDLRRDEVGFVFQFFNLLPTLSAWENVALPAVFAGARLPRLRRRAEELLDVAAVITLGGLQTNTYDTAQRAVSSLTGDDLHVSAQDFSEPAQELALPAGLAESLAGLDGVEAIDRARFAFVRVDGAEVMLAGLDPGSTAPILRLATPESRRAVEEEGAAVVSQAFARRRGVGAGGTFRVVTPHGPVEVPVAEVVGLIAWPAGFAAVSYDNLAVWTGTDRPTFVGVRTGGQGSGRADRAVRATVRAATPEGGITPQVIGGDEAVGKSLTSLRQTRGLFSALQGVLMGSGAFAIVSTLVISTLGRTRELGLLRAVGARRRMVRQAVVIEAFAVTLTGATIGLAVGSVFQFVAVRLASYSLGLTADFAFAPGPSAFALLSSVAIALVGALAALRRLLDLDVLEAIAYE